MFKKNVFENFQNVALNITVVDDITTSVWGLMGARFLRDRVMRKKHPFVNVHLGWWY
jgi:hypothetical protein